MCKLQQLLNYVQCINYSKELIPCFPNHYLFWLQVDVYIILATYAWAFALVKIYAVILEWLVVVLEVKFGAYVE